MGTDEATDTFERARNPGVRWWRLLGLGLLLFIFILVGLVTWFINHPEHLRPAVENLARDLIGRKLSIHGEFDFSLGRIVTLRATDISLQNATWSDEPSMLRLGQVEASLDLFSLKDDALVLTDIEARDALVLLEWQDDEFNWIFDGEAPIEEPAPPQALPLILDTIELYNVTLRVRNPSLREELTLVIPRATHQQDIEHRLVFDVEARLDDRPVHASGQIGPFPELAAGGAVDFDFDVELPHSTLRAAGDIDWLAELQGPNLELELQAKDAADLLGALKLPPATRGAVDIRARAVTEGEGIIASAVGQFGAVDIDARLDADSLRSFEGFDLAISSSGPSMRNALALAGVTALRDAPYELSVLATRSSAGLELRTLSLKTEGLRVSGRGVARKLPDFRDFDLTLSVSGEDYRILSETTERDLPGPFPFSVEATVNGKGAGVDDELQIDATVGSLTSSVRGLLSEAANFSGSSFDITLQTPDVRNLASLSGVALTRPAPLDLTSRLSIDEQGVLLESLQVNLDEQRLTGSGDIDLASESPGFDLNARIRGANLAAVATLALAGEDALKIPVLPYDATASLALADSTLTVITESMQLGGTELTVDGAVDFSASSPEVKATISAVGEDLNELLREQNIDGIPRAPFEIEADLHTSAGTVDLQGLAFKLGKATLAGDINVVLSEGPPAVVFSIEAGGPDLRQALPDLGDSYIPPALPFKLLARGRTDSQVVDLDTLTASLGDMNLNLKGAIQTQPQVTANGVQLNASGPRLSDIGTVGNWELKALPFQLSTSIQGDADQLEISNVLFRAGESELTANGLFDVTGKPDLKLELRSKLLDLDAIRTLADIPGKSEESVGADTGDDLNDKNRRVFSAEPLPFEKLQAFDSTVNIRIDDLISRQRRFRNIIVEARVVDGAIEAPRIGIDAAAGRARASLSLRPGKDGMDLATELKAQQVMLILNGMSREELDALPVFAIDAKLRASGTSPQQFASTLDGYAFAVGGTGSIKSPNLGPLVGDFLTELIGTVNPFAKREPNSKLRCSGIYFEATSGKLRTSPGIVIQSDKLTVIAAGKVDLNTEEIEITFETSPRKGLGFSLNDVINPFVMVTGTLSKPSITLDPAGTLLEGGTAVATMGVSIVGKSLWKRWIASRNACLKIADKALEARAKRDPENVPDKQFFIEGVAK